MHTCLYIYIYIHNITYNTNSTYNKHEQHKARVREAPDPVQHLLAGALDNTYINLFDKDVFMQLRLYGKEVILLNIVLYILITDGMGTPDPNRRNLVNWCLWYTLLSLTLV